MPATLRVASIPVIKPREPDYVSIERARVLLGSEEKPVARQTVLRMMLQGDVEPVILRRGALHVTRASIDRHNKRRSDR